MTKHEMDIWSNRIEMATESGDIDVLSRLAYNLLTQLYESEYRKQSRPMINRTNKKAIELLSKS